RQSASGFLIRAVGHLQGRGVTDRALHPDGDDGGVSEQVPDRFHILLLPGQVEVGVLRASGRRTDDTSVNGTYSSSCQISGDAFGSFRADGVGIDEEPRETGFPYRSCGCLSGHRRAQGDDHGCLFQERPKLGHSFESSPFSAPRTRLAPPGGTPQDPKSRGGEFTPNGRAHAAGVQQADSGGNVHEECPSVTAGGGGAQNSMISSLNEAARGEVLTRGTWSWSRTCVSLRLTLSVRRFAASANTVRTCSAAPSSSPDPNRAAARSSRARHISPTLL